MVEFIKSKKEMSEEDIKANFITPAIVSKGWKNGEHIAYEEYFTDGRIEVRGDKARRKEGKKSDYSLYYQFGTRIAIVEAKDNKHSVRAGLQQAIEYGEILDVPFVYSSNGDGFIEHDRITREERELELDEFPTREELFSRMTKEKGLTYEITEAISTPYYTDAFSMNTPRYYQQIAINRTIETVARGQKRVMFVMATGTGKTFMAFQIIHRLRKAGLAKRVLFLADRNILVDQTIAEDFKPFEKVMTKITPKLLTAPEKLNSFEIYLGLYQQLTGEDGTETHYQKFDKDFFDLIVIDEAHRGSAKENSNWRKIIDYFSSATQIGMTATPKETKNASNTEYFGEPIYTYSLKQGIEDGFLAPYRVMRVNLDVDVDGYRPETGKVDANGQLIEDRYYGRKDFDKTIVIDDRTQRVAKFVSDYMKQNNARFDKTIVFCVDIDHAERMRAALVKENLDLVQEDYRYVMQVTGDNAEGKAQLDNFMDVNSNFPAIVTTSKLLTTGVNAKTCRLIVLDSNIQSMTEFKQIIGRGTRLYPQKGKEFFTIIDFRNVTNLFADPDFDGDPVKVLETGAKTVSGSTPGFVSEEGDPVEKYIVTDKQVTILNSTVQVLDENGKLITESLTDYTRKNILGSYATLNDFITVWHTADKKKLILDELYKKGVYLDAIRESEGISEQEIDDFDLLLKLAYGQKELTKTERINKLKQSGYLYKYSEEARAATDFIAEVLNPKLGESMADLACGTGGFLTSTLNRLSSQRKTSEDTKKYNTAVFGIEKKAFPHLLAVTNLFLHEIDDPKIVHGNTLEKNVREYTDDEKFDIIMMNPPFGGSELETIKNNFPAELRSSETADLFMAVIMYRLKENGRVGVILPDGFLFGEGVKTRLKQKLVDEFNLHTIIRLPHSVFAPYTGIHTNILFFDKTKKTEETWFYRLDMPDGYKNFSKTKPMKSEHFNPVRDWWENREEILEGKFYKSKSFTPSELAELNYNLDQCGFPKEEEEILNPFELIQNYQAERATLNHKIDNVLADILQLLEDK